MNERNTLGVGTEGVQDLAGGLIDTSTLPARAPSAGFTQDSFNRVIGAFQARGLRVKSTGSGKAAAQAPGHSNADLSVSVTRVDGRTLVWSHSDPTDQVITSLGLKKSDLYDSPRELEYHYDNGRIAKRYYKADGSKGFSQTNTDRAPELYRLGKVSTAVKAGRDVYVCEGEEDVRALESLGVVATTAPQGAGNWANADYTPLVGASDVYVCADLDEPGMKRAEALAEHLRNIGANFAGVMTARTGNDMGDHVAAGHGLAELVTAPTTAPRPSAGKPFNAQWLMQQEFPPTKYVVPGIVPEGMTLLVAAPKIGKSWMVLGLGVELSTGGSAFGAIPVGHPRPVLYLALEDGKRRLQDRLIRLNPSEISHRLEFITEVAQGEVISTIRDFMQRYDGLDPVCILDTLGKVMPPAGNGNQYAHDYTVLSALKATTDAVPGSSLVIVHHTRKMDGGDFLDAVSGTQGIAGAADTVLVLKRDRHDDRATLQVTSRDAAEGEYSLILTETGAWELDGQSLTEASQAAQTARVTAGLGDKSTEVIEKVAEYPEGISPKDLKVLLPHIAEGTIDAYLKRALEAGRIDKSGRGKYTPIRTVSSASFSSSESHTSFTSYSPTTVQEDAA